MAHCQYETQKWPCALARGGARNLEKCRARLELSDGAKYEGSFIRQRGYTCSLSPP
ncbi:hypothetical protein CY34DRAFT_803214 [Suillus luteus UH-Slu-Lm8-n1]|uniref:Uncharacterized protein n=1 Tax=Suillus luteus UH-Slu-Lm8-n1 TaxID=930992 RepID=A0A0D0A225_9AGAM|nr:hypothetical protein CY34DRAFT_803214 [Suillus luteus UH-Slu-Lm8-n1]